MRIAVPTTRNGLVDEHFGHCESYTLFTIDESKRIVDEDVMASPQGCGCKSNIAELLARQGVGLMIAGSMGDGAVNVLQGQGINVVRGAAGPVREVVRLFIENQLVDSGVGCASHDHECGRHEQGAH